MQIKEKTAVAYDVRFIRKWINPCWLSIPKIKKVTKVTLKVI